MFGTKVATAVVVTIVSYPFIGRSFPSLLSDVWLPPQACGVCHSDSFSVNGVFGNAFPIVPGHEVVGKVSPRRDKIAYKV